MSARVGALQQFADRIYDLNPFDNTGFYGWGEFTVAGRQLWIIVIGWSLVALERMLAIH